MEATVLARLQDKIKSFYRLDLADSLSALEQPGYPIALVYDLSEDGDENPTHDGTRQILTVKVGVQIIATRSGLAAARQTVRSALTGWKPTGALSAMAFTRGQAQQMAADAVLWLDVYAVKTAFIAEPGS